MTDPISCFRDPALPPEVTSEEANASMSLTSAHPAAVECTRPSAPPPTPPAVKELVKRFAPAHLPPPPTPSLFHAIGNCKVATLNYVTTSALATISAAGSGGLSLVSSMARVVGVSVALTNCIEKDEAEQVERAQRENLSTLCRNEGGVPLTAADGSVLCDER